MIRTTNSLEQTNQEIRRCTRVVGVLPNEHHVSDCSLVC